MILLGSAVLTAVVRVLVGLLVLCRLLAVEGLDKWALLTGMAGGAALGALCWWMGLAEACRMALEALWIVACGRWQGAELRMGLFVSIFYEIGVALWQFLLMAGLGVLLGSAAFLDGTTAQGQAAVWLLHGLLLAGVKPSAGRNGRSLVSALAVAGFIGVITLSEQTRLRLAEDTLTMWTILALVLLMAIVVFHMRRQYEVEKELARLKAEQAQLLERDYRALREAYGAHARLFHDVHHHIGALRQLLAHGNCAGAINYLDQLQGPVRELTDRVWTGDETVDYLINSKAAAAAADGVVFEAQVEFPRHTNLGSADLCAIVGNLLDNALEAARQVEEPERRLIRLTIRRINQMLVLKVENSFAVTPVREQGRLQTTKQDGGLHGWGLQSVQTAAERYDGLVETSCVGDVFRAVVTLSYEGVPLES